MAHYRSIMKPQRSAVDALQDREKFIGAAEGEPGLNPQRANAGVSLPGVSRNIFDEVVASYVRRYSKRRNR